MIQEQLDDVTLESKAPLHRHRSLPTDSQKLRDLLVHLGHRDLEPRQNLAEVLRNYKDLRVGTGCMGNMYLQGKIV